MKRIKEHESSGHGRRISRRDFVKSSAALSLAALSSAGASRVFAAGSDKLRVGLIGCGDRGTGAAENCVRSSGGVEIVAMADLFRDKLDKSLGKLSRKVDDKVTVTDDTCFVGFDAYKKVLARDDVDVVLLTTPPGFRPEHLKAAVEAGKHVFMEKPAAVDPVGVRSVIAASELAKEKGLSIVAGTQQRRLHQYLEVIKRVHDGQIGEIVGGQCYWNWGEQNWHFAKRRAEWSDMEWQVRCWPYFTWLSGDHIVEQHLHNLDIINWAIGSVPVKCLGMGGRQARTGPEYGNIYDHFAVEYEYPGGVRVMSMCSQINGTTDRVSERVVGTKGSTYTTRSIGYIEGENAFKYDGPRRSGTVAEHADLVKSIRDGKPVNEGRQVAESTLTVIMGRMSAYTGRELKWDWVMNKSKLDLTPPKYEMGDLPVPTVAIPGKTELI
jgi:predicted dehydrogenase